MRKNIDIKKCQKIKADAKKHTTSYTAEKYGVSETTVRRVKLARSYKSYVSTNRARYTPINKYDEVMTTYIETPQVSWWDRFKRHRK